MTTKKWKFSVFVKDVQPGETVCLTGSIEALGNWKIDNVIQLTKVIGDSNENDGEVWTAEVEIPRDRNIYYRFCICSFIEASSYYKANIVVRKWETDITPRKISVKGDFFTVLNLPRIDLIMICDIKQIYYS